MSQACFFSNANTYFSVLSSEAMVLMLCSFYLVFKIIFYDVLYFCIVCSVLHFLLACYVNVAAHVGN